MAPRADTRIHSQLAKGHARSADPAIFTGYLGKGDASDLACDYADQTEPTITHSNRQSSLAAPRPNLVCRIRWRRCERGQVERKFETPV